MRLVACITPRSVITRILANLRPRAARRGVRPPPEDRRDRAPHDDPMEIPIPSELLKNQAFVKPGVYTIPIPLAGAGVHVWAGRKYAETMLVSSRFELL